MKRRYNVEKYNNFTTYIPDGHIIVIIMVMLAICDGYVCKRYNNTLLIDIMFVALYFTRKKMELSCRLMLAFTIFAAHLTKKVSSGNYKSII